MIVPIKKVEQLSNALSHKFYSRTHYLQPGHFQTVSITGCTYTYMIPTKSSKTKQLTPITFLFLFIFVWFQLPGIIVIISGRSSCSYNSPFSGRKTYSFRACASFEIGQILPISQVCQRVVNPVVRAVTASCSLS